ncbi:uncharacterized protein LOC109595106 [Aethina tumida]|uniref:uncharacterized protein LOC109595106 n=1 Tax=Aethina tumida TaxID=116153 RepID=UPI00214832CA|nr:uncharacterized protein LOC109595106 [Aethina tumida]
MSTKVSNPILTVNTFVNKFLIYYRLIDKIVPDNELFTKAKKELIDVMHSMSGLLEEQYIEIFIAHDIIFYYNELIEMGPADLSFKSLCFLESVTELPNDETIIKKLAEECVKHDVYGNCLKQLEFAKERRLFFETTLFHVISNLLKLQSYKIADCDGDYYLLGWLVTRLDELPLTDVRKSWIVCMMLTLTKDNPRGLEEFGKMNGIAPSMIDLAHYVFADISDLFYLNVIFNLLEAVLPYHENKKCFVREHGVQYLLSLVEGHQYDSYIALKIFNVALCGQEGIEVCKEVFEYTGLEIFFSFFMMPFDETLLEGVDYCERDFDFYMLHIIYCLIRASRCLNKKKIFRMFSNSKRKFDKILDLHKKYIELLKLTRDESFWSCLQFASGILLELALCRSDIKEKLNEYLSRNDMTKEDITDCVPRLVNNLAQMSYEDDDWVREEQMRLIHLWDSL